LRPRVAYALNRESDVNMKQRFWLFQRGSVFYLQDSETGKRKASRPVTPTGGAGLRAAKNEAAEKPLLGLTLGKAYLSLTIRNWSRRKWAQVMDEFGQRGRDSSRARYARALKSPALATLRDKKIGTRRPTTCARPGRQQTVNESLSPPGSQSGRGPGLLPWPIIPTKMWPAMQLKCKRGINFTCILTVPSRAEPEMD